MRYAGVSKLNQRLVLVEAEEEHKDVAIDFDLKILQQCPTFMVQNPLEPTSSSQPSPSPTKAPLSNEELCPRWQLRAFGYEGFMHLKQVIEPRTIRNCKRLLLHELGVPGSIIPGGNQEGIGKFSGRVCNSKQVRALLFDPNVQVSHPLPN